MADTDNTVFTFCTSAQLNFYNKYTEVVFLYVSCLVHVMGEHTCEESLTHLYAPGTLLW